MHDDHPDSNSSEKNQVIKNARQVSPLKRIATEFDHEKLVIEPLQIGEGGPEVLNKGVEMVIDARFPHRSNPRLWLDAWVAETPPYSGLGCPLRLAHTT
jgi:hypothetical protein